MKTIGSNVSVAFLAFLLFLGSCAPRLDLNPALDIPNDKAITNVDDLNQVLASAYASLGSKYFMGGNIKIWPDIISDQIVINPSSKYSIKEVNIAKRNFNPSDSLIILAWEQGYRAINLANHVIDKIENGDLSGETFKANKDRMLGEALFIRAVAGFELVRFFAPTYSTTTAGLKAIPQPLKPATERTPIAAPSLEVYYSQVKADLIKAASLLPFTYNTTNAKSGNFNIYGNATGAAAKGYLAKVLFQQGEAFDQLTLSTINEIIGTVDTLKQGTYYPANFPMVASNASSSFISGGAYRLYAASGRGTFDFSQVSNELRTEVIFNIMNRGDQDFSQEIFYRFTYDPLLVLTNPRYLATSNFVANVFGPGTDSRNIAYITGARFYNGRPCFQKWFSSSPFCNIILVRSAELVLTRARVNYNLALKSTDPAIRSSFLRKCLHDLLYVKKRVNRLNIGLVRPMDNINYVYNNANIPNNTTFEQSLDTELNRERQRELFVEGDRLHDLRRRGFTTIPGNGQSGAENIPEITIPLDQPILPVPISETAINSSLSR